MELAGCKVDISAQQTPHINNVNVVSPANIKIQIGYYEVFEHRNIENYAKVAKHMS